MKSKLWNKGDTLNNSQALQIFIHKSEGEQIPNFVITIWYALATANQSKCHTEAVLIQWSRSRRSELSRQTGLIESVNDRYLNTLLTH